MKDYYEIIVAHDKDYGEVISFETEAIMSDSNDIVSYAVKLGLLDEADRKYARHAMCISEYEYAYIICRRTTQAVMNAAGKQ